MPNWPELCTIGTNGLLIRFGDQLSEPANRAALAFRAAVEREGWSGVEETSTSLVSAYLRVDPAFPDMDALEARILALMASRDWSAEPLPEGRRLWRVPTVYGTDLAPQLEEAADVAGLSVAEAIATISGTQVRVQTIGFAPGQPYLGALPEAWNIPRQTALTDKVPIGALTVAIRQLTLFSVSTPTGWRHVGQTGFRAFRPDADDPFVLRPGDEVLFQETTPEQYHRYQDAGDPDGGAVAEQIA